MNRLIYLLKKYFGLKSHFIWHRRYKFYHGKTYLTTNILGYSIECCITDMQGSKDLRYYYKISNRKSDHISYYPSLKKTRQECENFLMKLK
jgi:hypothetical protein